MPLDIVEPIPDLDCERELKSDSREYPIDPDNPLFNEPLVPIGEYGLQGLSYYSQPNSATGDPVPGIPSEIYARRAVVEKLAKSNEFLASDAGVARALDGPVALYVREGFRALELQSHLHYVLIPNLLRMQNPDWTEEQVQARVREVIAQPDLSQTTVPGHFTGGAVDAILVSAESGDVLNTGFKSAHLGDEAIHTDFLEKLSGADLALRGLEMALMTRRVLYNVMTSDAPEVGGLAMASNPTETWHYSYGDQWWAFLYHQPAAIYGVPEVPEKLRVANIAKTWLRD